MSISMTDLLSGSLINEVPLIAQRNLEDLQIRINKIRDAWGKLLIVTSGFRNMQHHIDIYRTKALREKRSFSMLQVPMRSKHLYGQAVDIADPTGDLYKWTKANEKLLEEVGLWCEEGTIGWIHYQSLPPRSGKRWFLP